ncbi:hypothetical protein [Salinarimonas chemoclinalis]|uniref:hypothetical protein n=1 Tax=Salinarimonas chemoclinalis TaxID=3241599 RepID=UPI0035570B7F
MDYRYVECGLDDVVLVGLDPERVVDGERGVGFPRIGRLHRVIAEAIVSRAGPLSGSEVRFLRTEAGLAPAELAVHLGRTEAEVTRWEASIEGLPDAVEAAVRSLLVAALDLPPRSAGRSGGAREAGSILIDGSDPARYRVLEPERAR